MKSRKRVAITGMGVISSLGNSPELLHASLCGQQIGYGKTSDYFGNGLATRLGGRIASFQPEKYLKTKSFRPLDRTGQLVAATAGLALHSSSCPAESIVEYEVGLVLGTMFSSMHTIAQFDRRAITEGPAYASPFDFANTVINSGASQSAIWYKLRGINSTVSSGPTSGLMAIGYAADLIAYRGQTAILAGGADEFCLESFCACECAGLLHESDAKPACAVPFHRNRNGFALTEASALIMLEEWESALGRGAHVLGEIRGHASAYCPPDPSPSQFSGVIARTMRAAMSDACVAAEEIDCVSASANGSTLGDKHEAQAIMSVLLSGLPQLPVTAIKSALGETLAAGGALQTIDLLETMRTSSLPGVLNPENYDPGLPELNVSAEPRTVQVQTGLVNSTGFDGHACALVVSVPKTNQNCTR